MTSYLVSYVIGLGGVGDIIIDSPLPVTSKDIPAIKKAILEASGLHEMLVIITNIFELAEDRLDVQNN